MILTILPHRDVIGWTGDMTSIEGWPTRPAREALVDTYESDAHFVCYHTFDTDGVAELTPRVNKRSDALQVMRNEGADLRFSVIAVDVDDPIAHANKTASSPEWRSQFLDQLEALPADFENGCGMYFTRGGARLLWALGDPLDADNYELTHVALVNYLNDIGIPADRNTKDWSRLMRCPRVVRDGQRQDFPMDVSSLGDEPLPPIPGFEPDTNVSRTFGERTVGAAAFKPFELPDKITEGEVEPTLFRYASQLRQQGYEEEDIFDELVVVHRTKVFRLDGSRFDTYTKLPELRRIARSACRYSKGTDRKPQTPKVSKPTIRLLPDIHESIAAAEDALILTDAGVYQRDGQLVRPIWTSRGIRIGTFTLASMRSRLTWAANWVRPDGDRWVRTVPDGMVVAGLLEEGSWERFLALERVVNVPTLRPDGSVLSTAGYDPLTATLYDPGGLAFPTVADNPSKEDAVSALDKLTGLVCDFPFQSTASRSVAVAALLTGVVRDAFGPCPLFLFDSHTPGTGKSLLAELVVQIAQGGSMPTAKLAGDAEMDKRITAALLAGSRFMVLDNIPADRALGGASIDALLTCSRWSSRRLGVSEQVNLPNTMMVMATGNNVAIKGDLARRVLRCQINAEMERPETRSGFRHNLPGDLGQLRPSLVSAALTVIRAYLAAGAPDVGLRPLGSFGGWDKLIRRPLVWLGMTDPVDSQDGVRTDADTEVSIWSDVLTAWCQQFGANGVSAAQLAQLSPREPVRVLLSQLIRGDYDPRTIGYVLRRFTGRIVGGLRLEVKDRTSRGRSFTVVASRTTP